VNRHKGRHQVVVAGAGLAGLTAAWELTRSGIDCVVLESAERHGGRVETVWWKDAKLELGAHFLGGGYRTMPALVRELGLGADLRDYPMRPALAMHIDGGRAMVDPKRPHVMFRDGAVRARDVLEVMPFAPVLLAGLRGAAASDLTLLRRWDTPMAAPVLRNRLISALGGSIFDVFLGYSYQATGLPALLAAAAQRSALTTMGSGMQTIVDALASAVADVRAGHHVTGVHTDGQQVWVRADTANGLVELVADAVVLATPADVTAKIWSGGGPDVRDHLDTLTYSPLNLVYFRTATRTDPTAELLPAEYAHVGSSLRGFLVLDDWCDTGGLVIAAAGADSPAASATEDALVDILATEIQRVRPDLDGRLTAARPVRGPRYVPIFGPGTVRRLHRFRLATATGPVAIAGDHTAAPFTEGAAASGRRAAQQIRNFLTPAAARTTRI
jgi:protoporphyrinogen/coproporphyrinogen III oxidase